MHFPAGAIRKDGPSAGAAVLVALASLFTGDCMLIASLNTLDEKPHHTASLFTGRLARSDTAMTGEISLRGQVLPVGGVREKVISRRSRGAPGGLMTAEHH